MPEINGLRGIAILMVVYEHIIKPQLEVWAKGTAFSPFIFRHGWVGVNLFFVLSGLVLFLPYYLGNRRIEGRDATLEFYRRRSARLMPLFLINCFVGAFVCMHIEPFWFESFWRAITTLSMFCEHQWYPTINPALWSLMIEIYFALIFPFLFVAVLRFGCLRTAAPVFVISFVMRIIGACTNQVWILNSLPSRLDDFMLGMIICDVYFKNLLPRWTTLRLFIVGSISFIGAIWMCNLWRQDNALPPYLVSFAYNLLQISFFALVLGALRSAGMMRALFTNRVLQLLGMMCYSLYIWHLSMAHPLCDGWPHHPMRLIYYAAMLLCFSALSYRYIEFGSEKDWRKLFATHSGAAPNSIPLVESDQCRTDSVQPAEAALSARASTL